MKNHSDHKIPKGAKYHINGAYLKSKNKAERKVDSWQDVLDIIDEKGIDSLWKTYKQEAKEKKIPFEDHVKEELKHYVRYYTETKLMYEKIRNTIKEFAKENNMTVEEIWDMLKNINKTN